MIPTPKAEQKVSFETGFSTSKKDAKPGVSVPAIRLFPSVSCLSGAAEEAYFGIGEGASQADFESVREGLEDDPDDRHDRHGAVAEGKELGFEVEQFGL